ncbi:MAG: bifunctional oligoribonuclease/PAP phosphatase NrnA [Deltaproteobacteria bacterium]|nr:bifunctional oligoribonuclease/PAP phosphatase NrnA [Deltaproteobacteria bacterium]
MYNLNNINSFSANVDEIFHLIETSKKILIVTHENPEGDAISSVMSIGMFLKSLDKEIYLYDKDPIPLNLRFLPWSKEFSQKFPAEPIDLLIVVDCGELQRVGDGYENLLTINRIINIDHHFTNNNFGHANLVIPDASSTGEVLFYLFAAYGAKENNIEYKIGDELPCKTEERQKVLSKINKDIAICLYASILTDTGSFRYASATKNAFYIASVLNQYDINPAKIAEEIYETKPQEQYRLLAKSLATLELVQDGKIASMIGSKQMLNEVFENNENQQKGMALFENFVNYPRSINGVEIAIFFKEASFNEYRLSFRAKSYANVAKVAEKYGGGGHKFAAGCKVSGDLNNIKKDIYEYCREVL